MSAKRASKKTGGVFECLATFTGGCWDGEQHRMAWPAPPTFSFLVGDHVWQRYRLTDTTEGKGKRPHLARYAEVLP